MSLENNYDNLLEDIYNAKLKIAFVESEYDNLQTRKAILYDFQKCSMLEHIYSKDISMFNGEEIQELLKTINYKSEGSVRRALSYYSSYTDWCIDNGLRGESEVGFNDIANFMSNQDLTKYLPRLKVRNMYITKDDFDDIINILINPMDKAIVQCLYEGIGGQFLYELRSIILGENLVGNELTITTYDGEIRQKYVSDTLIKLLQDADEEPEYILENGNHAKGQTRTLAQSKYVFKPIDNYKAIEDDMLSSNMMINKMVAIQRYTDYNFITAKTITTSGAFNSVLEWTKEAGLKHPSFEIFRKLGDEKGYNMSRAQIVTLRKKFDMLENFKEF